MTKGKIILSAAALVVTVGSTFALKAAKVADKFNNRHQLYGTRAGGVCTKVNCWTIAGVGTSAKCRTNTNKLLTVTRTYFTKTSGGNKCKSVFTGFRTHAF